MTREYRQASYSPGPVNNGRDQDGLQHPARLLCPLQGGEGESDILTIDFSLPEIFPKLSAELSPKSYLIRKNNFF